MESCLRKDEIASVECTERMFEAIVGFVDGQNYSAFPYHLNTALIGVVLANMCYDGFTKKDYLELAEVFKERAKTCKT